MAGKGELGMANLVLQRKYYTDQSIVGELSYDGVFQCYTLEDTHSINGQKIPGHTAIPAGKYSVIYTQSPRFGTMMPLVADVPGFEGIRIHIGNFPKDTEGCILVGETYSADTPNFIGRSVIAFNKLNNKLKQDYYKGQTDFAKPRTTIVVADSDEYLATGIMERTPG